MSVSAAVCVGVGFFCQSSRNTLIQFMQCLHLLSFPFHLCHLAFIPGACVCVCVCACRGPRRYWHMGWFGHKSWGRTEGQHLAGRRGWIDTVSTDGRPVIESPHWDSISVFTLINTSSEGGALIFLQRNLMHSGRKPTCNPQVFYREHTTSRTLWWSVFIQFLISDCTMLNHRNQFY